MKFLIATLGLVGLTVLAAGCSSQGETSAQAHSPHSVVTGCSDPEDAASSTTVLGRVQFAAGVDQAVQIGGRTKDGWKTTKQPPGIDGTDLVVFTIPQRYRHRVQISGWGRNNAKYTTEVARIAPDRPCPDGTWAYYAGGLNFRGKLCLPLKVGAGGQNAVVRFGLGKDCPSA